MGKVFELSFTDKLRNRQWNQGYSDGYNSRPNNDHSEAYNIAYEVGQADRAEDEEAIASGQFDLLDEEERKYVYGNEERSSDYKDT